MHLNRQIDKIFAKNSFADDGRSSAMGKLGYGFLALILCFPLICCALFVNTYGTNCPMSDDFCVILYHKLLRERQIGILDVLRIQHNEHRQGLAWGLMLLLAELTNFNYSAALVMGLSFMIATAFVCLFYAKKRVEELSLNPLGLVPVPYLICSLRQTQTLLAVYQDYFLSVFFLVSTLLLLDEVTKPGKRLFLALVTGAASAFCFANGLLALPLGTLLMAIKYFSSAQRDGFKSSIGVLVLASLVIFCAYFWNFNFLAGEGKPSTSFFLTHLFQPLLFFTAFLGSPFCYTVPSALLAGTCLLLLAGITFVRLARKPSPFSSILALPVMLIFYAFLSGAMAALGRIQMGLEQAITSRYATIASYGWLGLYLLLFFATALEPRLRKSLLAVISTLIAFGLFNVLSNFRTEASTFRDIAQCNQEIIRTYRLQGQKSLEGIAGIKKQYLVPLIEYLEKNKMTLFAVKPADLTKAQLESGGATDYWLAVENISGLAVSQASPEMILRKSKETDLTISGWAVNHKEERPAHALVVSIDGNFDLPTVYGTSRFAVAEGLKLGKAERCGFKASCSLDLISNGEHKVYLKIYSPHYTRYLLLLTPAKFRIE